MRKLLFLVLIAIAVCAAVDLKNTEEFEKMLEASDWGKLWNEVKSKAAQAKAFLVQHGIWNVIKTALGTVGVAGATAGCTALGIPGWVCGSMVAFVSASM